MKYKKVALINPQWLYPEENWVAFPTGLAYLIPNLLDAGCEVKVFDQNVSKQLADDSYDLWAFTANSLNYENAVEVFKKMKSLCPSRLAVIGGPHVSFSIEEVKRDGFDFVIRGEGEEILKEFVTSGNLIKEFGSTSEEKFKNPDYSKFDLGKYEWHDQAMLILSSRGCPSKCNFCVTTLMHQGVRMRKPADVEKEILDLLSRYPFKEIEFQDDVFTVKESHVQSMCEMLQGIGLPWFCETRPDTITPKKLKMMVDSGCRRVAIGAETGSNTILKNMNKGFTVDTSKRAIQMIKDAGLETEVYFVIGYEGETEETLKETKEFLREVRPTRAIVSVASKYPGTELWRKFIDLQNSDWEKLSQELKIGYGVLNMSKYVFIQPGWTLQRILKEVEGLFKVLNEVGTKSHVEDLYQTLTKLGQGINLPEFLREKNEHI